MSLSFSQIQCQVSLLSPRGGTMEQCESSDPPGGLVLIPAPVGLHPWPPWASVCLSPSLGAHGSFNPTLQPVCHCVLVLLPS